MKDIIAVDVDDVVCDLISTWISRYNFDYKDNLNKNSITDWDIGRFVLPSCGKKIYKYIEDPSIYNDCQPIEDSLEAINLLKKMGRVIFVTSPTIGCAGRKYVWLKDHGYIDKLNDYVEARDKSLIKYSYLIDDGLHNVKNNKNSYLFSQPWNTRFDYPNRINNWREFIDMKKGNNT
jgi:5'(3')-deoxyribonucleotidase